jgi:hypothetical protein
MNSRLDILFFTAGLDKSTESKINEKHKMKTASSLRFNWGLHVQKRLEKFSNKNDKYELRVFGGSILAKKCRKAVGKN